MLQAALNLDAAKLLPTPYLKANLEKNEGEDHEKS
jgi:hypothetical protein